MEKFWRFRAPESGLLGAAGVPAWRPARSGRRRGVSSCPCGCSLRVGRQRDPNGRSRPVIWTFGSYALDTDVYELRAGGQRVALEPQAFDVLAFLVAHHDRVVTKEELLD